MRESSSMGQEQSSLLEPESAGALATGISPQHASAMAGMAGLQAGMGQLSGPGPKALLGQLSREQMGEGRGMDFGESDSKSRFTDGLSDDLRSERPASLIGMDNVPMIPVAAREPGTKCLFPTDYLIIL